MLAVGRPSMNPMSSLESHYQETDQPFGFIFGAGDEPTPAPEARAPGKPLLNDSELFSSNQFFDQFQNDSLFDDPKMFESFDPFSHEPLQNFQGVSSSLGNPLLDTSPIHTLDFASIGTNDLTSRFGQAQLSSPTAGEPHGLHELSPFTQPSYTSYGSNASKQSRGQGDLFGTHDLFPRKQVEPRSSYGRSSAPTLRQDSMSSAARPAPPSKHGSVQYDNAEALASPEDAKLRRVPAVGFGTDSNFQGQRYMPPGANINDLKSSERMIQSNVEMFNSKWERSSELPSTKTKRRLTGEPVDSVALGFAIRHDDEDDMDVPMKKAKKVQRESESPSGDEGPGSAKKPKSKRKGSEGHAPGAARRKSGLTDAKAARQNLTEEEKKQNHIRSEQKRRNQIKEGFDNLQTMMPDNSAGASKCAILSQAVDWLSDLIEGNEQLRAQLESMG